MTPTTVDFETDKAGKRPDYPPRPVGVAIRQPSGEKKYLAWGHPTGNNATIAQARAELVDAYKTGPVLFHNGPFDLDVGEAHMGLPMPKQVEDSMFMAFLDDPYEKDFALKPLSEKKLGIKPKERDRLKDWIIDNVKGAKRSGKKWGEHIAAAPGDMVAPYAIGDVDRTFQLYEHYAPIITKRSMEEAYEREINLIPVTMEMERSGVRVDVKGLKTCLYKMTKFHDDLQHEICKNLGVKHRIDAKDKKGFNLNSSAQLAAALMESGKLNSVTRTKTGKISTKVDILKKSCNDQVLLNMLGVHSVVKKYITSFIEPWMEKAERSGGRLLPRFNQVLSRGEDGGGGARSGRYSSSDPNMQNISANVEDSQNKETLLLMQKWLKKEYQYEFMGLRDFIIPDEGMIMTCVDYNQQEIRLLAHFESADLMRAYIADPKLDVHEFCRQLVHKSTGVLYPRKHIKITVFGIIYGMGVEKLAKRLEISNDTARQIKNAILQALPGVRKLMKDLRRLADRNKPLITWGGREYYCEEPKFDEKIGQWRSFEYRMLNYQIQPSAADSTKQGMLNVHAALPNCRIAVQVHDELVVMVPHRKYGPKVVEAMCDMKFRVPMLAEAKYSEASWARAA